MKTIVRAAVFLSALSMPASAWALPRDVRRLFTENGSVPGKAFEAEVRAYPEPVGPRVVPGEIVDSEPKEFRPDSDPFVRLTKSQSEMLMALLADPRSYAYCVSGKACGGFHTDIVFRISGANSENLFVHVCFGCNEVILAQGEKRARADWTSETRNKLIELARVLFPKETSFQKISPWDVEPGEWMGDVMLVAEMFLAEDPLYKRVSALKPEDISVDDLDVLAERAKTCWDKAGEEDAATAEKEAKAQ